jgi:hypothetical protein
MCGERVRRCRAACRAQGGAGYLLDPEGPAAAGARARRDSPVCRASYVSERSRRGATGPGGDPRISWNWSVDRTAVVALLIGSGAARSPRRLGRSLYDKSLPLIPVRGRGTVGRYVPGVRRVPGPTDARRTASQWSQRPAGRPWRRRAGYLSRQPTAPPRPVRDARLPKDRDPASGDRPGPDGRRSGLELSTGPHVCSSPGRTDRSPQTHT